MQAVNFERAFLPLRCVDADQLEFRVGSLENPSELTFKPLSFGAPVYVGFGPMATHIGVADEILIAEIVISEPGFRYDKTCLQKNRS